MRTLSRVAAVGAGVVLSVCGAAGVAHADPATPSPTPTVSASASPAAVLGQIEVNAFHNGDGDAQPVSGVVFTVTPIVGIPTTQWADVIANPNLAQGHEGTPITLPATTVDGHTVATDLPEGLWLLHQTSTNDVTYNDLVFALPTNDSNGNPLHNLTVFPKPLVVTPGSTPTPVTGTTNLSSTGNVSQASVNTVAASTGLAALVAGGVLLTASVVKRRRQPDA